MRIGDFEFTNNGSNFHVKYVGKPEYLTTASPNNHPWIKELLNKLYGRHEFVYKAPPLEFKQFPREEFDERMRNRNSQDAVLPLSTVRTIIFKNEKETAMDKNMKDYVGCKVLDVRFFPPHTTIFWDDGTVTRVKCSDEPYDSEKGFAMAVMKRLFGDCYFKDMKDYIEKYGGYEKDTHLIRIMCGEVFRGFGFEDSTAKAEEIEKLKKENDRLLTEINTFNAVRYGIVKANENFKKENEELYKRIDVETTRADACRRDYLRVKDMYDKVVETNRKLHQDKLNLSNGYNRVNKDLYDHKKALEALKERNAELIKENEKLEKMLKELSNNKEELCVRLARTEALYSNQCAVDLSLNARIDDLKKAKENMAKKLAETKSLRQENAKLKENLDRLQDELIKSSYENGKLRKQLVELDADNDAKEARIGDLKCRIAKAEAENEKYKDLVDMQKKYDEVKKHRDFLLDCEHTQAEVIRKLRLENEALRISIKQIEQIKEILK